MSDNMFDEPEIQNGIYDEFDKPVKARPIPKKAKVRIIIGIILIAASLFYFVPKMQHERQYKASVNATILAVTENPDGERIRVYFTVDPDEEFNKRLIYVDDAVLAKKYYNGDTDVKILFDPDNPKDYIVVSENSLYKTGSYVLISLGALLIAGGALRILFAKTKQENTDTQAVQAAYYGQPDRDEQAKYYKHTALDEQGERVLKYNIPGNDGQSEHIIKPL